MDDETALRLEQIKLVFQTAERTIDLHARYHLAILAVALTSLVTIWVAALARQLTLAVGLAVSLSLLPLVIAQVVALHRLGRDLAQAGRRANDDVENLMVQGGEPGDDAAPVHPG